MKLFIGAQNVHTRTHTHGVSGREALLYGIASMSKFHFYANIARQSIYYWLYKTQINMGGTAGRRSIDNAMAKWKRNWRRFVSFPSLSLSVCMCLLCTRHHTRRGYLHPSSALRNNFSFQNRLKNKNASSIVRDINFSTRNTTLQTDNQISKNSWAAGIYVKTVQLKLRGLKV